MLKNWLSQNDRITSDLSWVIYSNYPKRNVLFLIGRNNETSIFLNIIFLRRLYAFLITSKGTILPSSPNVAIYGFAFITVSNTHNPFCFWLVTSYAIIFLSNCTFKGSCKKCIGKIHAPFPQYSPTLASYTTVV